MPLYLSAYLNFLKAAKLGSNHERSISILELMLSNCDTNIADQVLGARSYPPITCLNAILFHPAQVPEKQINAPILVACQHLSFEIKSQKVERWC